MILPIAPGGCTAVPDDSWPVEFAVEAFERYGDDIIPFCHVNPLAPDALD